MVKTKLDDFTRNSAWMGMNSITQSAIISIVLVHGAFVDGSGWEPVYHLLRQQGYQVSIVQHPTTSLGDDVAVTRRVIAQQAGPVILVGHSYGGAVISEAGNDPKVKALVYIAAFALDDGESVAALLKDPPPPGTPVPPILPPQDGFLSLDPAKAAAAFAGDLPAEKGAFLADAQLPWGVGAFAGTVSHAAWHDKPSWYLVATDDLMIPPPAQQFMAKRAGATVVEVRASHAVYVSRPDEVAKLIQQAAAGVR